MICIKIKVFYFFRTTKPFIINQKQIKKLRGSHQDAKLHEKSSSLGFIEVVHQTQSLALSMY